MSDNQEKKEYSQKQLVQIQKYIYRWATMIYVESISERLSGEVLKIASLSDDEVSSKYPRIDIQMLRRAAERIENLQGKTVKEQKEIMRQERDDKKRANFERIAKIKDIANGGFYENGIITQEQFDTFLSSIPSGYTRIIQNAQNMWKLFNEYKENSSEELIEKRESLRKEVYIIPIYRKLIDIGIFADFEKMKNKTIDELEDLLEIAKNNPDKDFNRKNYIKTNPLSDIIIDSESKDDYLKQNEDIRRERIDRHEVSLWSKIRLINSVLKLREQEIDKKIDSLEQEIDILEQEINSQEQEKDNHDNIIGNENEIKTVAQKLTNVFLVLKEYGINLAEIKIGVSRLGDLISDREDADEIMEKLQTISEDIKEDWKIGEKLNDQKRTLDILKNEIEKSGMILTDKEKNKLFDKMIRISTQEFVKALQILKEHNIDLSSIKMAVENQSVLSDLLVQREDADEILAELQEVSKDMGMEWKIGGTLLRQKKDIAKFVDEIEKSGLILSQEEKSKLIEKQAGLTSEEFVQALIILKRNGINISDIKSRSKLNDLLNDSVDEEKIVTELQEISPEIGIDWRIGVKLNHLKGKDKIVRFKADLEKSIGNGVVFTEEEIHSLLDRSRGKDTSNGDYIIGFMRKIVSERKDSIGDNIGIGEIFESAVKTVEKGKNELNKE